MNLLAKMEFKLTMVETHDVERVLAALTDGLDEAEQQWCEQTLFASGYIRPLLDIVFANNPRNMDSFLTSLDSEIEKHAQAELSAEDVKIVLTLWERIRNECKTQFV